jgi:hypothetical protein
MILYKYDKHRAEADWDTVPSVSPCWVTGPSEQPDLASIKDLRSTSQNAYQSIIDVDNVKSCTVPVRDHAVKATCLAPPARSQCIAVHRGRPYRTSC